MYRTHDQVASEFIAEGKRRNITERGIVICIATGLVESGLVVFANAKVPESLNLPHDAVGSDGYSVGPLQQQVRQGNGGKWWWGPADVCMDPTKSAGLFYDRLARLDYNGPNSPGSYAQAVQSSAFPDRYDQRMVDAQAIYDRLASGVQPVTDPKRPDFNEIEQWSPNSSSRGGTTVDAIFLHTSDGVTGDNAARDLTGFLCNPTSQVSYHYAAGQASDGGVTVYDVVDTNEMSWSVLSANARSINYCFAGSFAAWTRAQWLQQAKAIDVVAYLVVQDCRKYKIPTKVIAPPYTDRLPGVSDHAYVTKVLKDGTHTDVGPNFPWDVFSAAVTRYANPAQAPDVPPVTQPKKWPQSATDRELLEYIAAQLGPGDPSWPSKGKTLRDKVWGL